MLFNREQYHDGRSYDKEGIDYVMLYIKPELVAEILGKKELRFQSPIVYDVSLARSICALSRAILDGNDETLCTEQLIHLIGMLSKTAMDAEQRKNNRLVKQAKEMMYGSIGNVLKLDDLCKEFGMSKYQLIREFKAHTGISPYQFF